MDMPAAFTTAHLSALRLIRARDHVDEDDPVEFIDEVADEIMDTHTGPALRETLCALASYGWLHVRAAADDRGVSVDAYVAELVARELGDR